jgi:hypothetical protein
MQAKGTQRSPDERIQRALLALALNEHPARVSADELARGFGPDVDQAIRSLVAVGLLRRDGESICPTEAAIRFEELA